LAHTGVAQRVIVPYLSLSSQFIPRCTVRTGKCTHPKDKIIHFVLQHCGATFDHNFQKLKFLSWVIAQKNYSNLTIRNRLTDLRTLSKVKESLMREKGEESCVLAALTSGDHA